MQAGAGEGRLLIDDVVVIDDVDPSSTARQSVLIADGRVEYVGPRSEVVRSWSGPRIEGAGRWVVPGLLDLHIHTTDPADMSCYVANGVTTVRFAGIDSASVERLRRQIRNGAMKAPELLSAGPMLDTVPPSWPQWAVVVSDREGARATATELLDREPLDALFGVHGLTAELLEPIVEVARSRGLPVAGQLWRVDAREAAELGVRQLDNTSRVIGTRRFSVEEMVSPRPVSERLAVLAQAWVDIDWPQTEELMAAMVDGAVAYCPTLVVWKYLAEADGGSIEADPDFTTFFSGQARADFAQLTKRMTARWSSRDWHNWAAAFEIRKEWVSRFRTLGGTVVLGTDMQFGGIAAHVELGLLVECGLSPTEAIAAATNVAAEVAGRPDIGRVAANAYGDLLVLDQDPRLDIRNLRNVHVVVQRGIATDPTELRTPE